MKRACACVTVVLFVALIGATPRGRADSSAPPEVYVDEENKAVPCEPAGRTSFYITDTQPSAVPVSRETRVASDRDATGEDEWLHLTTQPERAREIDSLELDEEPALTTSASERVVDFSAGASLGTLSSGRRRRVRTPSANIAFGVEAELRATTDGGSLLAKSPGVQGISVQSRTPIITDIRTRGDRTGKLAASGSYWVPARQDLDTLMSKIDSRIVADMIVIKGPYSALYGPGFNFVDVQVLQAPRYADGYESHGSSSLEYKTNGEQVYGRQTVWGGGERWGFRVGYGHRTGNDYNTGNGQGVGFSLPTSYNSRDLDVALGYDFSPDSHLEFLYLRQDQTDVEFPGLVFDINSLVTDGYELEYVLEDQPLADRFTFEAWYNKTRFAGDTLRLGKNRQIPSLRSQLSSPDGMSGFGVTDVAGSSTGQRTSVSWGDPDCRQLTVGTDLFHLRQRLDDLDVLIDPVRNNFPIPPSRSTDVGIFVEQLWAAHPKLTFNLGTRVDFVNTDSLDTLPNLFPETNGSTSLSDIKQAGLEQHFTLWSVFLTGDYAMNENWTVNGGAGYAQRAPTLTEMYAYRSFIGTLQPGLTFLTGDPELDPESLAQLDVGVTAEYDHVRFGVNGFYSWIHDYIVYETENRPPGLVPGTDFIRTVYGNTDLATILGGEANAEVDLTGWLTGFATVSYVEGTDRSRNQETRLANVLRGLPPFISVPRSVFPSFVPDPAADVEPLPGIPPLNSVVGLRLSQPGDDPRWGLELSARIVDNQDRVANSLYEEPTPGFTIWNLRGYWKATEKLLIVGGVENIGDKFYRQHLDYRSGLGVFQPGVNFYASTELTY